MAAKTAAFLDKIIFVLLGLYALSSSVSIIFGQHALYIALFIAAVRYALQPYSFNNDVMLFRILGVFLGTILLVNTFSVNLARSFAQFKVLLVLPLIPLVLIPAFVRTRKQLVLLMVLLGVSLLAADAYAIWQGLHGNFRAQAFTSHPMVLAGILEQLIPLFLVLGMNSYFRSHSFRIFLLFTALVSIAALLFNGTRGAWLAVVVVLAVILCDYARRYRPRLALIVTAVLLIGAVVVAIPPFLHRAESITNISTDTSNTERLLLWQSAVHMIRDYPFYGVGMGNFGDLYRRHYILPEAKEPQLDHAHNTYLQYWAESGPFGLASFIFLFGYILYRSHRAYRTRQNVWGLAVFLVTVSLLVQGLTEYLFWDLQVTRMYWFILGLAYAGTRQGDRDLSGDGSGK